MKIAVIGLGSMGRRRISLIRSIAPDIEIIGMDANPQRCAQVATDLPIPTCVELDVVWGHLPEAVLVCSSPASHKDVALSALDRGCDVFLELNLVSDGYAAISELANARGCVVYQSSTLRKRVDINFLRKRARGRVLTYNYHVGQYLPNWHPWEDINSFFVSARETNGCRELMAIELPWIAEVFSPIMRVMSLSTTASDLGLDFPDSWSLGVSHENGSLGAICVDVVDPIPQRRLTVVGEGFHVEWNGTPDSLLTLGPDGNLVPVPVTTRDYSSGGNYAPMIVEEAYAEELREFLDCIATRRPPEYSLAKDAEMLRIIDSIEKGN